MSFIHEIHARLSDWENHTLPLLEENHFHKLLMPLHNISLWLFPQNAIQNAREAEILVDKLKNERLRTRVIIIWEDYWHSKQTIVLSRLRAAIGQSQRIHGRACQVVPIRQDTLESFLLAHHLIGPTRAKYRYGLVDGTDTLQAVASFSRSVPIQRNTHEYRSHELIRFCHRSNHHVNGGLSKLLAHFRKLTGPEDIYTSVDRDWSSGGGYTTLGFKPVGETPPKGFCLDQAGYRYACENNPTIWNTGNIKMVWDLT